MLAAVVVGGWLTLPAWGPAPPAGDDVAAHLVRADFAFNHIFGDGHLDGWFPRFMVGHQEFLFYGQGYSLAVGVARLLTFGALSTVGAVKVVGILAFVGLAPAVMFLARGFGVPAPAAVSAGLLALAVNSPFGIGLHSTYVIGLLPNQLAAVTFCIALGAAAWAVRAAGLRWVALTGGAFSFLALTHVVSAGIAVGFLALVVLALVVGGAATPGWLTRLSVAGALALGLTAFWAVPFLAHRDLRGPVTAWRTPPFLERAGQILSGDILFPAGLSLIAAAAVLVAMLSAPRAHALIAAVPAVYLSIAHTILATNPGNPIAIQLPNRGLGYAGLIALVPVGVTATLVFDQVTRALLRVRRVRQHAPLLGSAGILVAATAASAVFGLPAREVVAERNEPTASFEAAATALGRLVPDGARFATERDYPAEIGRAGFTHPDLWLAEMSGRDTLNNFNPESSASPAGFVTEDLGDRAPQALLATLSRFGVSHVVTVRRETADDLVATGSVELAWQQGAFSILALDASDRVGPLHAEGLDGTLRVAAPERIAAAVELPRVQRITAALSWSPKWEVRIDGERVPTRPSPDRIVSFEAPAGTSDVEIRFRRDEWDLLGKLMTVATLGVVALVAYRSLSWSMSSLMSRRRSRTA